MYTLYLDESGDEGDYDINNNNQKDGSSRYFTLGGIIVNDEVKSKFENKINEIKSKHFPHLEELHNFKLHYFELREGRYPFNSMDKSKRKKIADDVFRVIGDNETECYLLSATIDLHKHCEQYKKGIPIKPRAYSLILIKERYQYFLEEKKSRGKIIYEEYDNNLRKHVQYAYDYLNRTNFHFYSKLENIDGDVINGNPLKEILLQFADFAVYPAYRKCKSCNTQTRRFDEISHKYYNLNHEFKTRRGNLHV